MQRAHESLRRLIGPTVEDGEDIVIAAPARPLAEIARRFWPDVRPYRRWLAAMLFLAALGPALDTATIWLYKLLVDEVLVPRDFAPFPAIAAAYFLLTLAGGAISFGDDYLAAWTSEKFLLDLRLRVFAHLQRMPPVFFAGQRRGDLLARLTDDVDDIESLLVSGVVDLLSSLARIVFFTGALFILSWRLALLSLVVTPLFWLASRVFSRRIKGVAREQRRRGGAVSAVAEESLANMALVQAYNLEEHERHRFQREALGEFAAQMAITRMRALFSPILDLFELAGVLVVVGAGAWELTQGNLTLGALLVFLTYLTQLLSPVRDLTHLITSTAASSTGADRVIEILDHAPGPDSVRPEQPSARLRGSLRFERVTVHYPGAEAPALLDVSFHLEPGQMLAITGASGAGKSTAGRLLARFLEPASGRIVLDGHDLRDLNPWVLRHNLALVPQESFVFAGTIRDNIALGRPGATGHEVIDAAKAADAHQFITALPEGYDTPIGQGGANLSGGQRQRLAIARALLRDAPILLLDEPTSGLDAGTAARILAPLRRLMADRTTIVISHDLLLTREATEILVLDQGRVVERGTHEALLRQGGVYARLYRLREPGSQRPVPARELAGVA